MNSIWNCIKCTQNFKFWFSKFQLSISSNNEFNFKLHKKCILLDFHIFTPICLPLNYFTILSGLVNLFSQFIDKIKTPTQTHQHHELFRPPHGFQKNIYFVRVGHASSIPKVPPSPNKTYHYQLLKDQSQEGI
jgi:hypothetical protein